MADGVGRRRVTSHQKRLTAATAKVDLPPIAAATQLGHPLGPAKPLEHRRREPDLLKRMILDAGKLEPRDLAGCLTGQDEPVGRDSHGHSAPPLQTSLRIPLKVVANQGQRHTQQEHQSCALVYDPVHLPAVAGPDALTHERDHTGRDGQGRRFEEKTDLSCQSDGRSRILAEPAHHQQIREPEAQLQQAVQNGGPGQRPDTPIHDPIAAALYSMRALRDQGAPIRRRVELIISLTEESDWTPFREVLAHWMPPQLNIALDAVYPVVTAEHGSGAVCVTLPPDADLPFRPNNDAYLVSLSGGRFPTQIPAEAEAVVTGAGPDLTAALRSRSDRSADVTFDLETTTDTLRVRAHGVAAHSSTPWEGCNAITHLAALLDVHSWPPTPAATMMRFINDLVGTSHYADRFGAVAYAHDFMGPLTLALTTVGPADGGGLVAGLNIRRPVGRSREAVDAAIRATLDGWKQRTGSWLDYTLDIGDPYYLESAPHIPVLLDIFRFYTGRETAGPLSIGGGTQARLVPNGLNFGPAMPDEAYTGHSEHEFMTVDRLRLALQTYAAALVELAAS